MLRLNHGRCLAANAVPRPVSATARQPTRSIRKADGGHDHVCSMCPQDACYICEPQKHQLLWGCFWSEGRTKAWEGGVKAQDDKTYSQRKIPREVGYGAFLETAQVSRFSNSLESKGNGTRT